MEKDTLNFFKKKTLENFHILKSLAKELDELLCYQRIVLLYHITALHVLADNFLRCLYCLIDEKRE